jgi:outer membrane receptor protein involved in Fe transport
MLDYIDLDGAFPQTEDRLQVTGFVSGDLTDYGVTIPGADDGIQVVLGFEYRDEELVYAPDEAAQSGDFAGFGSEAKPVHGGFDLWEVFTEARVPIIQGKDWAELVSLELGYRYSDYSTGATADTYKIAGEWMINPSVRLRASFQRAVRAGDMWELFFPTAKSFDYGVDSCVGPVPISSLEECQNTGLTAAQYGTLFDLYDDGYEIVNTIVGGNPDLDPEEADTWSFGFIFTPEFLPSMSLSVDYFDIELEKAIEAEDANAVFNECMRTGLAEFCGKIQRDPATGSLLVGDAHILATNTNIAFLQTSGVDVVADYGFGIGRAGDIRLSLMLTYLDELKYQEHLVADVVDCVGTLKLFCDEPSYRWAGNLRTVWATPWDASITLTWRHTDKVRDEWPGDYQLDIKSMDYFDLAAVWDVSDAVTVRLGVNNLLDEDPPLWRWGVGVFNGNTFPGNYDALGRYWFTGLSVRL